jgi:hypothetical protein
MRYLPNSLLLLALTLGGCTIYTGGDDGDSQRNFVSDAGWVPQPEDGGPLNNHDAGSWNDHDASIQDAGALPDAQDSDAGAYPDAGYVPDAGGSGCWQISSEALCIITAGCDPLYLGVGCSCDANGCGCNDWQFQQCQ